MPLPEGYVFSQSSLQDYVDCPRRFQLRHIGRCRWPAPETADALEFERRMELGSAFHRLMRQLHTGLPAKVLEPVANSDPCLSLWWSNYVNAPPQELPDEVRLAETTLSAGVGAYRVEARYDLLAGKREGRWVIVDWKTGRRRTRRTWLAKRLQTRIYPLVFVKAGATTNGNVPVSPDQVEMLYWFAEFPSQPERFDYSPEKLAEDSAFLWELVREIDGRSEDIFPLTENEALCQYCVYRSLCHDNVQAGPLDAWEDEDRADTDLEGVDWESIAPIAF